MEDCDRAWREITGRILIELAKDADEVHRVVLGMGQRIK
jgi:adenosyl cobinamide kinase/adenosyl cobinamide phosphate guanylyltransferase